MRNISANSLQAAWWKRLALSWDGVLFSVIVVASLFQVFLWLWPSPPLIVPEASLTTSGNSITDALKTIKALRPVVIAPPMSAKEDLLVGSTTIPLPTAIIRLDDTPDEDEKIRPALNQRTHSPSAETLKPMSLNRASAQQLEALPRIGPKLAQRIIDYRKAHGPFHQVAELDNVKGIGPKMLEKISAFLIVP